MSYTLAVSKDQPKQKTRKGQEIPIPKRQDFEAALNAVAKPVKKSTRKRRPIK
jgi:hypothetical protein